jgi:dipeptidyl aminopeptidase/acylaminoacyl peptidase
VSGPACDLLAIGADFPDGVCGIYRAVAHYDMPYEDAVKRISPIYQLDRMPKIPYFVAHTDADEIIRIEKHAEPFVAGMRARGHDVTYRVVPGQAHCDIGPGAQLEFDEFVFENCVRKEG